MTYKLDDIKISTLGTAYSTPAYIPSVLQSPTSKPVSFSVTGGQGVQNTSPGVSTATIKPASTNVLQSSNTSQSSSAWSKLLNSLSSALTNLHTALSNILTTGSATGTTSGNTITTTTGGVVSSGKSDGSTGSSSSIGSGGSSGSSGVVFSTPSISTAITNAYLQSRPVYGPNSYALPRSGLTSELVFQDNKQRLNDLQQSIVKSAGSNVPTRKSWLTAIQDFLVGDRSKSLTASLITPPTGTTTTTKPTKNIQTGEINIMPVKEINKISTGEGLFNQLNINELGSQIRAAQTIQTNPRDLSWTFKEVNDTFNTTLDGIIKHLKDLENSLAEYEKRIKNKGDKTDDENDDTEEQLNKARGYAAIIYPEYSNLHAQIEEIDKVIMNAMAGFRKTAEDIRNNPDLTVWQQQRRLRELDDLLSYAPIFNGLTLKDLIAYRGQLADKLNFVASQYNRLVDQYLELSDTRLPYQKTNDELDTMMKTLNISTALLEAQQQLANYGYSVKDYQDNLGRWHRAVIYTDPRTKQMTVISDVIIGQGKTTSTSTYNSYSDAVKAPYYSAFNQAMNSGGVTPQLWATLREQWDRSGYKVSDFDKIFAQYKPTTSSTINVNDLWSLITGTK